MKILICGAKGQLGSDCARILSRAHRVAAFGSRELDITDPGAIGEAMRRIAPEIVINCAAFTRVDACETERRRAWEVNAEAPRYLARLCRIHGSLLIHISTDYVFDGKKRVPEPYTEADKPAPLSHYGRTKLEGELAVQGNTDRYIIVRTSWLYGESGSNFLRTMLGLSLEDPDREIRVVNDQFGSVTWSHRLALQIARLVQAGGQGIYHASSEGYASWFEVAGYFLQKMGVQHNVVPCTTEQYPTAAARPRNSILENKRLKEAGINLMPPWEQDLNAFVETCARRWMPEFDRAGAGSGEAGKTRRPGG